MENILETVFPKNTSVLSFTSTLCLCLSGYPQKNPYIWFNSPTRRRLQSFYLLSFQELSSFDVVWRMAKFVKYLVFYCQKMKWKGTAYPWAYYAGNTKSVILAATLCESIKKVWDLRKRSNYFKWFQSQFYRFGACSMYEGKRKFRLLQAFKRFILATAECMSQTYHF